MYLGDSLVFQAKGFPANGASEVHVLAQFVMMGALSIEANVLASGLLSFVVAMLSPLVKSERSMFETDAIFLFARTIVEGGEQVMIDEKSWGAEDSAISRQDCTACVQLVHYSINTAFCLKS